jgi:hypothetical protein
MPLPLDEAQETKVVRTRRIAVRVDGVEGVLLRLRREAFTGSVTIHMSQGGMQEMVVQDAQRLPLAPIDISL